MHLVGAVGLGGHWTGVAALGGSGWGVGGGGEAKLQTSGLGHTSHKRRPRHGVTHPYHTRKRR